MGVQKKDRGVFGVPLFCLVEEGRKVPLFIDRLISAIEMDGLYTVGIYRKAGATGRIRQLIKDINEGERKIGLEGKLGVVFCLGMRALRVIIWVLVGYDSALRTSMKLGGGLVFWGLCVLNSET